MPRLVVVDDARARHFAPFSSLRAWSAMPVGALPAHDRWAFAFPGHALSLVTAAHLDGVTDTGTPARTHGVIPAGTIVANGRAACALRAAPRAELWTIGGAVAAVRLGVAVTVDELLEAPLEAFVPAGSTRAALDGAWCAAPWDAIGLLQSLLPDDLRVLANDGDRPAGARDDIIGEHPVSVGAGATIEPYVVFDTTAGAVVIQPGAHVSAFTRIAGPCWIGAGAHLLGGRISGSVIGPQCRVHGDVSASILAGYVNKAHEGFVGHSIIGRWANLGAGTTTSNLKNSYGEVRMWTPEGERSTGLTFLGALIGEHAKLGIGTMLGTGTLVGAGANLFGTLRPPKVVPPFAWGDAPPYETFSREKFVEVATNVMARRQIALDETQRLALARAYDHTLASTS